MTFFCEEHFMAKPEIPALRGIIVALLSKNLKEVWRAFARGSTWKRVGHKRKHRARFRHSAYTGELLLEWWGPALRFEILHDDSGMFSGAFLGQVKRHGRDTVDWLDIRFED